MSESNDRRRVREQLEQQLPDLVYDELDAAHATALRSEARACGLGDTLDSYARLRAAFAELPDQEPPAAISAQIMLAAARHARASDACHAPWWARARAWLAATGMRPAVAGLASFVVVAGVAGLLLVRGGDRIGAPAAPTRATPPATTGGVASGRLRSTDRAERAANEAAPAREAQGAHRARSATGAPSSAAAQMDTLGDIGRADNRAASGTPPAQRSPRPEAASKAMAPRTKSPPTGIAEPRDAVPGRGRGQRKVRAPASPTSGKRRRKRKRRSAIATDSLAPPPVANKPSPSPATQRQHPAEDARAADSAVAVPPDRAPGAAPAAPKASDKASPHRASPEAVKLHHAAVAAARADNCPRVRTLRARIERLDPVYYRARVAADPALARCRAGAAAGRKRK